MQKDTTTKSTRVYAGTSAAERKAERREKFLAAALEVIGTQGFRAATVRTVCAEAGLTNRYYYETFRDQEDLLIQVYHQQLDNIAGAVLAGLQIDGDLQQKIRSAVAAFYQTIRDQPRLARIVFLEILGVSPAVDQVYRDGTERFVHIVLDFVRSLLPTDHALPVNPELVATAAIGSLIYLANHWILSDYKNDIDGMIETTYWMLLTQIEALIQPEFRPPLAGP